MTNQEKAISFLELVAMGQVQKAYDQFTDLQFIHHNQYFKGDRKSLMEAMQEAHEISPNKSIEIKDVIAQGEKVMTYSLVQKSDMDIAVVHIFLFSKGKIIEMWDLGQGIEPNSPNENGLF